MKKKQCKCEELLKAIKRKQGFMDFRLILIYEKLREIEYGISRIFKK